MTLAASAVVLLGVVLLLVRSALPAPTRRVLGLATPLTFAALSITAYALIPLLDVALWSAGMIPNEHSLPYDVQFLLVGDTFERSAFGVAVAVAAFCFGYLTLRTQLKKWDFVPKANALLRTRSHLGIGLILYVAGLSAHLAGMLAAGGIDAYYSIQWAERVEVFRDNNLGYLLPISALTQIGVALVALASFSLPRFGRYLSRVLLVPGIVVLLMAGVRSPILDIAVFVAVSARVATGSFRVYVPIAAFAILTIVGLQSFRTAAHLGVEEGMDRIEAAADASVDEQFRSTFEVFSSYQLYMRQVYLRPNHIPYLNGATLIKPFVFWIPRSIWPEKPDNYTLIVARDEDVREGISLAAGLQAEGYSNFGWLGIALVMMYVGCVTACFQVFADYACARGNATEVLPWVCVSCAFCFMLMRFPVSDNLLRYGIPYGTYFALYLFRRSLLERISA